MINDQMKYYLGVDGGGTKTKFIVCRRSDSESATNGPAFDDVELVGEYTSTCCHYLQIGFDGVEELIREGVHEV